MQFMVTLFLEAAQQSGEDKVWFDQQVTQLLCASM